MLIVDRSVGDGSSLRVPNQHVLLVRALGTLVDKMLNGVVDTKRERDAQSPVRWVVDRVGGDLRNRLLRQVEQRVSDNNTILSGLSSATSCILVSKSYALSLEADEIPMTSSRGEQGVLVGGDGSQYVVVASCAKTRTLHNATDKTESERQYMTATLYCEGTLDDKNESSERVTFYRQQRYETHSKICRAFTCTWQRPATDTLSLGLTGAAAWRLERRGTAAPARYTFVAANRVGW